MYAVAETEPVESVAVTVCWPAADGGLYRPVALIVPTVVLPPATPSTDQAIAFWLVVVNCWLTMGVSSAWRGLMANVAPTPVPLTETVCELLALSVMTRVALLVPPTTGVNVTLIVQF